MSTTKNKPTENKLNERMSLTTPVIAPVMNLPVLAPRPREAHKGMFGHALIIAGSSGMSGAAVLAGQGALRGGAGLVTVAVPETIWPIVAASEPSYLTLPLPCDSAGRLSPAATELLLTHCQRMSAVAIGPGLGRSPDLDELVLTLFQKVLCPLVVDADGLNALAEFPEGELHSVGQRVLTPHPGEFGRLTRMTTEQIARDRAGAAVKLARTLGATVVLKGAGSVVTDGQCLFINSTGNSGLATGGSGDVLTGLIVALLAQGMPPFSATQLAVYLHGLAGDLAAAELSQPGLIAADLPRYLPFAWKTLLGETA